MKIMDQMNYMTRGCIYVLQSDKDPKPFGMRAKQHAYDIDSGLEKAVTLHFEATNSGKENLRVTPIMRVRSRNPWVQLYLERDFINKYNLVDQEINQCL